MVTRLAAAFIWSSFFEAQQRSGMARSHFAALQHVLHILRQIQSRSAFVIAGRDLPTVLQSPPA